MLTIRKKSTLSDVDHHAAICSDILRECVYHGKEFYERMKPIIDDLAQRYGFHYSSYFRSPSYEHYYDLMKNGSFSTWSDEDMELKLR